MPVGTYAVIHKADDTNLGNWGNCDSTTLVFPLVLRFFAFMSRQNTFSNRTTVP